MLSITFKKKLLIILLIIAGVLLAVNIFLQLNENSLASENITLEGKDYAAEFRKILDDFDIDDSLVKETKTSIKNQSPEVSSFKIQVPKDLTIPEILLEVYNTFRKDSISISSVEKVKNGKTTLQLKYGTKTLLSADFDYSKTYSRNKGYLAFIIEDVDLEDPQVSALIDSPFKINFLLRPEPVLQKNLEYVLKNGQQYSVLIDDDVIEQKYKLGPNFSEQRVINVVKTLVTDFKNSVCFVLDENSDFYKSKNYEVLKRELTKRKIKLFTLSEFTPLFFNESLITDFDTNVNSLEDGESIIFLVNEEVFDALKDEILKFQKRGFRVIASSLILINE